MFRKSNGQDMTHFSMRSTLRRSATTGNRSSSSRTRSIGKGIPEVAGTAKAHGEAGAKFVDAARKGLGLPDEHYFVSKETYDYFAEHKKKLLADYDRWEEIVAGLAKEKSRAGAAAR